MDVQSSGSGRGQSSNVELEIVLPGNTAEVQIVQALMVGATGSDVSAERLSAAISFDGIGKLRW